MLMKSISRKIREEQGEIYMLEDKFFIYGINFVWEGDLTPWKQATNFFVL